MIATSTKTKNHLLKLAKVVVLAVTFGYVFYKLRNNDALNFGDFITTFFSRGIVSFYLIFLFLLFAAGNWYFEILKWKTLISTFEKIDFKTAMKQSLASLTVSLATPNRIGEYGAKALFFESKDRKKVLLLNFYSGANQMLVTIIFGMIGLFYLLQKFNLVFYYESLLIIGLIAVLVFAIGYFLKKKELLLKGFSIAKMIRFFNKISLSVKVSIFIFSLVRYIIFSSLFLGLLLFFGANISVLEAYFLIFAMYFLVSILPTIFILDVVIRGGVAVWLFSFAEIPEMIVLSTVLAMWLLNFVLPSLLGSIYVVTYQPTTK